MKHVTVLQDTAVNALGVRPGKVVVDATLGSGGHTKAIAEKLNGSGKIIACDVDPDAINDAQLWCGTYDVPIILRETNFKNVHTIVGEMQGPDGVVDGIIADLGWRSEQFSSSGRGFSFSADEPLQMTFGNPAAYTVTASDIVNQWEANDIKNVLFGYSEERFAARIATAIVNARAQSPICTSGQLARIVHEAVPFAYQNRRIHPATKTFQALRIAVNDEFSALDEFITNAMSVLATHGHLVIITFHSLEDRIVKHRFREFVTGGVGTLPHRKPRIPERSECVQNPRARSAKLRTITKL
jgi:16S rRNA (cytosine1402-N4)-methyltransferase